MGKALFLTLALAASLVMGTPGAEGSVASGCVATLWAGQHTDAGTVTVHKEGENLLVTYQTSGDWRLSEVHLEIRGSLAAIPQKNGNPIPGKFTYKAVVDTSTHTFSIPCADLPQGELYIAAHGVVGEGSGDTTEEPCDAELLLPSGYVQACFEFPGTDAFANVTLSNAGDLDGTHGAWCVDMERGMGDCNVDVMLVSTLDPAANGLVDRSNFDLLNYLLNQDYSGWGADRDEIQAVIWALVDDGDWRTGAGVLPNIALAEQILADVIANGAGYVPGHGDYVAVILWPRAELQTTIIKVRLPDCPPPPPSGGEETAWAGNLEFPGKNWALYFTCDFS